MKVNDSFVGKKKRRRRVILAYIFMILEASKETMTFYVICDVKLFHPGPRRLKIIRKKKIPRKTKKN